MAFRTPRPQGLSHPRVKELAASGLALWPRVQRRATLPRMRMLQLTALALAMAAAPLCLAQWQWVDKDGRKVFSDKAPPPDVPEKNIVKRPGTAPAPVATPAEGAASSPDAATAQRPAASAPKLSGKDKDLEEKARAAQAAASDRKKAEDDAVAKQRATNCDIAKKSKALIDSGTRLATTNAKGEREIMDDAARQVESKRLEGIIASDCKPAS